VVASLDSEAAGGSVESVPNRSPGGPNAGRPGCRGRSRSRLGRKRQLHELAAPGTQVDFAPRATCSRHQPAAAGGRPRRRHPRRKAPPENRRARGGRGARSAKPRKTRAPRSPGARGETSNSLSSNSRPTQAHARSLPETGGRTIPAPTLRGVGPSFLLKSPLVKLQNLSVAIASKSRTDDRIQSPIRIPLPPPSSGYGSPLLSAPLPHGRPALIVDGTQTLPAANVCGGCGSQIANQTAGVTEEKRDKRKIDRIVTRERRLCTCGCEGAC